ncbi:hypothetical protein U8527_10505 [Kordia algicida OT-1]|uniref:Uncharacterized protein n=1 Tax=Kordia algicida OT-1 TaxID=391587 RepID=A9DWB7_9FLAO|nr:hypothetical protein [Kordia algicida]EDP96537.1 hypothetical protein KAOT1_03972 [Kordia algicida OT-1]
MAIQIQVEDQVFLIPEAEDTCDFWTSYYRQLKKKLGKHNAKMIWLVTWKSNGSTFCSTSPTFNKWLKTNDLNVSNMATRTIADLSGIGGSILGFGKNMTKILSLGIPILLIVVLIGIVIMLRNSTKNATIKDLAMLTPAGQAAKLLGK